MNYLEASQILGVSQPFDIQKIKKAYRNKAKILHPDAGGLASEFIALQEAYTILCTCDEAFETKSTPKSDRTRYSPSPFYQPPAYQPPKEKRPAKTKKGFVKYWKCLYRQAQSQLKLHVPPSRIGVVLLDGLKEFEEKVCHVNDDWFLNALFEESSVKNRKEHMDFLLFIAPNANERIYWANTLFELEFGDRKLKPMTPKVNWK